MANLIYKIKTIKNSKNADLDGKVYAKAVATETLSFQEFIDHIISHGSVYDRGTVQGIMFQMVDCMKELMLDSKKIWLGDLGVFYLSLKNKSAADLETFSVTENVIGVKVSFRANLGKTAGLDSKTIRKEAKFINVLTLSEGKKKKEDGDDNGGDDNGGNDNNGENPDDQNP